MMAKALGTQMKLAHAAASRTDFDLHKSMRAALDEFGGPVTHQELYEALLGGLGPELAEALGYGERLLEVSRNQISLFQQAMTPSDIKAGVTEAYRHQVESGKAGKRCR